VSLKASSPLGSLGSPAVNGANLLSDPTVICVAEKLEKTPAQIALRWGLQMGQSVLPKSANEARIRENFDIFNWSIPEDLMAKFSEIKQACLNACFLSFDVAHSSCPCLLFQGSEVYIYFFLRGSTHSGFRSIALQNSVLPLPLFTRFGMNTAGKIAESRVCSSRFERLQNLGGSVGRW
jgi:hypothetical protein